MIRCFLILVLAAGEFQQRLPRPLDPAELFQPESIRAILLLYSGKSLSKPKADELEASVRKAPEKIDERVLLIGYYSANGKTPADRARLRTHVLWMIEHHPEHPSTAEPVLRDLPDDSEGNAESLALWKKHLELRQDDLAVLKNAEKFFFAKNPAEAERLIRRISASEPSNSEWPNELAHLYRMFGIPGDRIDDAAHRAAEAYKRVLALTRNPTAREDLAGDMADAAFKVGDFIGAAELAKIHLQSNDRTAPQRANTILGRVALRAGDIPGAQEYLLASATPRAEKDISLSGPTMILAKELLEHGANEVVLQYLDNCLPLWPRGESMLQIWKADIKNGKTPNFGNLGF